MDHVAIDLGGRESQICVRSADGTIVEERRWPTAKLHEYLSKKEPSRVILETCAEAFRVADQARSLGHDPRVVAATLVGSLGVGERRTKTDKRDARKLSEVSCRIELPSVHIPAQPSRDTKTMLGMRQALVGSRSKLIHTVRGWLRQQAISIPSNADAFVVRVREAMKEQSLPSYVERQLTVIDTLTEEIQVADKEIAVAAKKHEVCPRLMSVPGVGPITAMAFVAAVDEIKRFKSAHDLEAYLGLTPGEYSSSGRQSRTSITKAGSSFLRWCLVQAAWSARRTRSVQPMVQGSLEVEKRRGKRVAIVALARKMAGILFAIFRDGTLYDPRDSAACATAIFGERAAA